MPDNEQNLGFRPVFTKRAEKKLTPRIDLLQTKANEGRIRTQEQTELERSISMRTKLTRRRLLTQGIGAGSTLLVGGTEALRLASREKGLPEENKKLAEIINGLPETRIKALLVERILPRFMVQEDQIVSRSDFTYGVKHARARETQTDTYSEMIGDGLAAFNTSTDRDDEVTLEDNAEVKLVFPDNFFTPDDLKKLDPEAFLPDGTPVVTYHPEQGDIFPDKLSTGITINRAKTSDLTAEEQAHTEVMNRYLFVKEACSLLEEDLFAEETFNNTREHGLPTTLKVRGNDGNEKEVDIVHMGILAPCNGMGRAEQLMDGGGFVLAGAAIKGTDMEQAIRGLAGADDPMDAIGSTDFSGSSSEILQNMMKLSVEFKDILAFYGVQGNADLTP